MPVASVIDLTFTIGSMVIACLEFDGLPYDDLTYQLKYRFVIDRDYFPPEYSTNTLFNISNLLTKVYYNPADSIISLNPIMSINAQ